MSKGRMMRRGGTGESGGREQCPTTSSKLVETAGSTAADCAAICCCWPCGLLNVAVTALVKLPAGLCRRAIRNRRRKMRRLRALHPRRHHRRDGGRLGRVHPFTDNDDEDGSNIPWLPDCSPSEVATEFDKEMLAAFYDSGFWRSPSVREPPEDIKICLVPSGTKLDSVEFVVDEKRN